MTEDAVSLKSRTEDHFLSCILPQSDRREDHPGIGVIAQLHTAQKNRGWEMKTSDTYRISCLFSHCAPSQQAFKELCFHPSCVLFTAQGCVEGHGEKFGIVTALPQMSVSEKEPIN